MPRSGYSDSIWLTRMMVVDKKMAGSAIGDCLSCRRRNLSCTRGHHRDCRNCHWQALVAVCMRYRVRTLVMWMAFGPPMLCAAYAHLNPTGRLYWDAVWRSTVTWAGDQVNRTNRG